MLEGSISATISKTVIRKTDRSFHLPTRFSRFFAAAVIGAIALSVNHTYSTAISCVFHQICNLIHRKTIHYHSIHEDYDTYVIHICSRMDGITLQLWVIQPLTSAVIICLLDISFVSQGSGWSIAPPFYSGRCALRLPTKPTYNPAVITRLIRQTARTPRGLYYMHGYRSGTVSISRPSFMILEFHYTKIRLMRPSYLNDGTSSIGKTAFSRLPYS